MNANQVLKSYFAGAIGFWSIYAIITDFQGMEAYFEACRHAWLPWYYSIPLYSGVLVVSIAMFGSAVRKTCKVVPMREKEAEVEVDVD